MKKNKSKMFYDRQNMYPGKKRIALVYALVYVYNNPLVFGKKASYDPQ